MQIGVVSFCLLSEDADSEKAAKEKEKSSRSRSRQYRRLRSDGGALRRATSVNTPPSATAVVV
jgi:hypothetical protein